MIDYKHLSTPFFVNEKLVKEDGENKANATLCRGLVGNLLYLIATRPNIMLASSLLSKFMDNPSQLHFGTVKRVLRHIKRHSKLWDQIQNRC